MTTTATTRARPAGPATRRVAAGLLTGQAAVAAAALIVNVLSARVMGPAGRGQIAWYLQLSYLLAVLALAGTDRAYPALADRPNPGAAVRHMTRLAAPGVVTVLGGCLTLAVALAVGGHDTAWMVLALGAVAAGNAALSGLRAAAAASSRAAAFLTANVTGQLALVAAAGVLCAAGAGSPLLWLTVYAVCLTAPTAAAAATLARRRTPGTAGDQPDQEVRCTGRWLLPGTLANIVALRADRLLLPGLASYDQLGWYVIAATMTELITWPVQAYVDAHLPTWARTARAGTLNRARILTAAAAYAAVAAGTAAVTIRAVLIPVFGDDYRPAVCLVWPLAAAAGLYGLSRVGVGLAVANGRHRHAVGVDLAAAAAAVTSYVLLIPGHGAAGAAWGSLVGYGVAAAVAVAAARAETSAG